MLKVTQDLVFGLFAQMDGNKRIKCVGIPEDAKCIQTFISETNGSICFLIESNQFPEVSYGEAYPSLEVTITTQEDSWRDQAPMI